MPKKRSRSYLKRSLSPAFVRIYKTILYHKELSFGAKCFAFALLLCPKTKKDQELEAYVPRHGALTAIANNFQVNRPTVSKWKKQLENVPEVWSLVWPLLLKKAS